jgi:hypothetical protein
MRLWVWFYRPVIAASAVLLAQTGAVALGAADFGATITDPDAVAQHEYPIYDRVVQAKFLTSETKLVMIKRSTVTQLGPGEPWDDHRFLQENELFGGRLQPLLNELLNTLRHASRLEPKFRFGVPYRLVSDEDSGDDEVSLVPVPAHFKPIEYDGTTIMLQFSRVAFSPPQDRALVYVGNYRADGSGAGFLVLLNRRDRVWNIEDTEVIWTASLEAP